MAASKAVVSDTLVVDGLGLANQLRDEMAKEIEQLVAAGHRPPQLTVVLVGEDPASRSYIKGKQPEVENHPNWT